MTASSTSQRIGEGAKRNPVPVVAAGTSSALAMTLLLIHEFAKAADDMGKIGDALKGLGYIAVIGFMGLGFLTWAVISWVQHRDSSHEEMSRAIIRAMSEQQDKRDAVLLAGLQDALSAIKGDVARVDGKVEAVNRRLDEFTGQQKRIQ